MLLLSTVVGVGVPGEVGLKVTCCPLSSTAVHWLADGHATPDRMLLLSTVAGVGLPGEVGLKVTCRPLPSTAVHLLADGHATPVRMWLEPPVWSRAIGPDHESEDASAVPGAPASAARATPATSNPLRDRRPKSIFDL